MTGYDVVDRELGCLHTFDIRVVNNSIWLFKYDIAEVSIQSWDVWVRKDWLEDLLSLREVTEGEV